MKYEPYDSLLEVTVRKSIKELRGIEYGRDVTKGVLPINTRILGSSSEWGLVYDLLDLSFTKQVVKMEGEPSSWEDLGVIVGREEELDLYAVLYSSSSIELCRLKLDDSDNSIEQKTVIESIDTPSLEGFGLTVIRKEQKVEVYAQTNTSYDYPFEKVLEGNISSRNFKGAYGLIGWGAEVNTWFLKHLLLYGRNSSYNDYSFKWKEEEGFKGLIEYIPTQTEKLYYTSGNKVNVYLKPFRKEGIGNDMYGNLSLAFSGFIEDIKEKGLPSSDAYTITLLGNRYYTQREENITLLESIDEQNRTVSLRDYYDTLEDLYGLTIDIKNFSSSYSVTNPPLVNLDGSLKNAEETLLIEENKQARITPAEEGIRYNIDIYERGEGDNKVVRHEDLAENEEEAIIEDINLEVETGRDKFYNKFISQAKVGDHKFRFMRENRYDKFFGDELDIDITKEDTLPYSIEDLDLLSDLTEDFIDLQNLKFKAEVSLVGHHHYLAGVNRQGTITIGHQSKALEDIEFYIEELTIDPEGTKVKCTESPQIKFKERVKELEEEVRIEDISDIFSSIERSRMELLVDEPIGYNMLGRGEEARELRLLDEEEEPLTKWTNIVHNSYYRGYAWIDSFFTSRDLELDGSIPHSNYRRPKYIEVETRDNSEIERIYKLTIEDFYSYGTWLLPSSYNISSVNISENEIILAGDITDYISRIKDLDEEIDIKGAGDSDGTFTIIEASYDGSNTIIKLDSDIDEKLEGARIKLEDNNKVYITIGLQQALGLLYQYIPRQLVLGHAGGTLGYEGRLGHARDFFVAEIVRDWSKNIYMTKGIE